MLPNTQIKTNEISQVYLNDLECPICNEIIGSSTSAEMVGVGVLICGHVFCLKCITEYQRFKMSSQAQEIFECPKCRRPQQKVFNLQSCPDTLQMQVATAIHQAKLEQQIRRTKLAETKDKTLFPFVPSVPLAPRPPMPRLPLGPPMSGEALRHPMQVSSASPAISPRSPNASEAPQIGQVVREGKHPFWVHHYCERCHGSFGMIGMRYHCRVCRRVICSSCSRAHPLRNLAQHGLSNRVCRDCFV